MELVQIYFTFLNKFTIITNFPFHFFCIIFQFFPPGSGSGSRREIECRSGSTALEKMPVESKGCLLLSCRSSAAARVDGWQGGGQVPGPAGGLPHQVPGPRPVRLHVQATVRPRRDQNHPGEFLISCSLILFDSVVNP